MKIRLPKQFGLTFSLICTLHFFSFAQNEVQSEKQSMFKPNKESFKQYKYPEWFRDAKFGIWAHWGPQAVPRYVDWYARKMY